MGLVLDCGLTQNHLLLEVIFRIYYRYAFDITSGDIIYLCYFTRGYSRLSNQPELVLLLSVYGYSATYPWRVCDRSFFLSYFLVSPALSTIWFEFTVSFHSDHFKHSTSISSLGVAGVSILLNQRRRIKYGNFIWHNLWLGRSSNFMGCRWVYLENKKHLRVGGGGSFLSRNSLTFLLCNCCDYGIEGGRLFLC